MTEKEILIVWAYGRSGIIFTILPSISLKYGSTYLAWLASMGMADTLEIIGCKVKVNQYG